MAKASEPGTGLLTGVPGIKTPKVSPLSSFCFYFVLLLLAGAGALGCFFTAFSLFPDTEKMVFAGILFAVLGASFIFPGKHRWILRLIPLLIWGLLLWAFFEEACTGCFFTLNAVFRGYEAKMAVTLPVLPAEGASSDDLTVFSLLLEFFFFWLLSWLWVDRQSSFGAFAATGIFLLVPLAPSILSARWALGCLILYWSFLLFCSASLRHSRFFPEKGRADIGGSFSRAASLPILVLLALALLAAYKIYPPESYERPPMANQMRTGISDGLHISNLIRNQNVLAKPKTLQFSSLGPRRYTGETVFQVRHTWDNGAPEGSPTAQKDYLKSFVGSVYTSSGWESLSENDAADVEKSLDGYYGQTLLSEIVQTLPVPENDCQSQYSLSVRGAGAPLSELYIPYGMLASPIPESSAFSADGALQNQQIFFTRLSYDLRAVGLPEEEALLSYSPRLGLYLGYYPGKDLVQQANGEVSGWDLWKIDPPIRDQLSPSTLKLTGALESYNSMVYELYTQVPGRLRPYLTEIADSEGLSSPGPGESLDYARQVRDYLARQCTYTLSPPAVPSQEDFVSFFLSDSRRGYCVHFATAAVLLLRNAGIPARYAEGYAVPVDEDSAWTNVPDENAHAWVELYFGGTGWVPFEVTPAGSDAPGAYRNARSPEAPPEGDVSQPEPSPTAAPSVSSQSSPGPQASPSAAPQQSSAPAASPSSPSGIKTPEAEPETTFELTPLAVSLISVPAALLLLCSMILMSRRLRVRHRGKAFAQRNRNRAALAMYAHLLRLCRENERLTRKASRPPARVTELAQKARFSQHILSEQEIAEIEGAISQLADSLSSALPLPRRLFCRYILALF